MRKRGLCCRPVSVCLSVTYGHSIHMAEVIVKLLCRSGSPIILVFPLPAPVPNSKQNPFSGGHKVQGGGKILRTYFRQKSPYISETVRDSSMVAMER